MLLLVVGVVLAGVLLVAAMLVLVWFLLKKKGERSVDVSEEFKGISSRPSFRNAIHQSFVNQTQNTAAVIYTLDEYYGNGKGVQYIQPHLLDKVSTFVLVTHDVSFYHTRFDWWVILTFKNS